MGLGFEGLGFEGLGFDGLGFGVEYLAKGSYGLESGLEFKIQDLGFRV